MTRQYIKLDSNYNVIEYLETHNHNFVSEVRYTSTGLTTYCSYNVNGRRVKTYYSKDFIYEVSLHKNGSMVVTRSNKDLVMLSCKIFTEEQLHNKAGMSIFAHETTYAF